MADSYAIPLQTEHAGDGCVSSNFTLTPMSDTSHLTLRIPPNNIVPVIFVPGIMGSNLVSKDGKSQVWPAFSSSRLATRWAFRSASSREDALSSDVTALDHNGPWFGYSATVGNESEGLARGQGTVSKEFYGNFVVWLDNALNGNQTILGPTNPWFPFVASHNESSAWYPEKKFDPMMPREAIDAWSKYWCPVYAQGYNWTRTTAENGRLLAAKIKEIINYWSSRPHKPVCEKVILVSHSMGGLVCRAAIGHDDDKLLGNASDKVAGIVHGVQPATGAPAAYHHCHRGYEGKTGFVLGDSGEKVSAVFANCPGAIELLPNQLYTVNGKKGWLKASISSSVPVANFSIPLADPYKEIYAKRTRWFRLMNPAYVDPSNRYGSNDAAWGVFMANLQVAQDFHYALQAQYHPNTYVTYGADTAYPTWNTITWKGWAAADGGLSPTDLQNADVHFVDDKFTVIRSASGKGGASLKVPNAEDLGNGEIGDGTVAASSGEAPFKDGGVNVKQSFRMRGFEHQGEYNNENVRMATLYAIGKILSSLASEQG
ncbi:lipase family alpha/beta hydrolase [Robbsia andropogonis]|uniref:lipase family alpha/beta hydrolase n=1 Tax=Robbsia andropogonis TaxID=28092 RepID=UPI0020A1B20E|nr:GPI inositol-deacylase [Robbsia andropogonis]MCP1118946.1 GPI inositol-deacylase [Robbsia andropogonis]MCP1128702.1 GPI inositol-deacylase [Robbsia andropogonis]